MRYGILPSHFFDGYPDITLERFVAWSGIAFVTSYFIGKHFEQEEDTNTTTPKPPQEWRIAG